MTLDVEQFCAYLTLASKSENTIRTYRSLFLRWCDWATSHGHNPWCPDPVAVRAWTAQLHGSRSVQAQARATISHLCVALATTDVSGAVPLPRKPRPQPRPIDLEAARRLLAYAPTAGLKGTAVLAAMGTAARRVEIAGMAWDNLDFAGRTITYWRPKVRDWHTVPLVDELAEHLEPRRDAGERWLFPGRHGGHVTGATIWRWVSDVAIDAGVGHVPTHRLRHTALTHIYRATKDVRLVQQVAGHSSLEQTAVYTEVGDDDLRAGMASLGSYGTVAA